MRTREEIEEMLGLDPTQFRYKGCVSVHYGRPRPAPTVIVPLLEGRDDDINLQLYEVVAMHDLETTQEAMNRAIEVATEHSEGPGPEQSVHDALRAGLARLLGRAPVDQGGAR